MSIRGVPPLATLDIQSRFTKVLQVGVEKTRDQLYKDSPDANQFKKLLEARKNALAAEREKNERNIAKLEEQLRDAEPRQKKPRAKKAKAGSEDVEVPMPDWDDVPGDNDDPCSMVLPPPASDALRAFWEAQKEMNAAKQKLEEARKEACREEVERRAKLKAEQKEKLEEDRRRYRERRAQENANKEEAMDSKNDFYKYPEGLDEHGSFYDWQDEEVKRTLDYLQGVIKK